MASGDHNQIELPQKFGSLLKRADQAAIAVILTLSLMTVVWSASYRGCRQTGLIDIDQAEPWEIDFLVDVNTADWPELSLLPNIGEVLARRIVDFRQQEGPFTHHDQLQHVPGIGPKTMEAIRPFLAPLADSDNFAEQ
jgi:competence protein ComEA